jgi:hypothetical protein
MMRSLLLFLVVAGALLADSTPIAWNGGSEFSVQTAPPGYEFMHYGSSFSTTIEVPPGIYVLTLRFIEPTVKTVGSRVFDVAINDQPVLSRFDVFARAGFMQPIERAFVVVVKTKTLAVDFTASVRSAIVSGIQVAPVENLLWPSPDFAPVENLLRPSVDFKVRSAPAPRR